MTPRRRDAAGRRGEAVVPKVRDPSGHARASRAPSASGERPPERGPASVPPPELLAILVIAAAAWAWFRLSTGIVLEDALITARYAENLAAGRGYVFNAGERVLGTTSPLHTLVIAALALPWRGGHVTTIAVVVGILSALGAVFFLHRALRAGGLGRGGAAAAAALFAFQPDTPWAATGGLETPLLLLLMAMGLHAALEKRWTRAALAAGLAVLARADALVWAGLLLAMAVAAERARAWRSLLAGVAVVAPWLLFSTAYFGSPVPHSIVAKRAIQAGSGLVDYRRWLLDSLGLHFEKHGTPIAYGFWIALVALGALAILARRERRRLWPVVAFPILFAAAMAAVQAPWFEWYFVPVTWCGIVMVVVGAETLVRVVTARAPRGTGTPVAARAATVAIAAMLAYGVIVQGVRAHTEQKRFQENEDRTRRALADWLRAHTPADAVVAMEAIGYQGTYSGRRVVDLAGIVTPEVVNLRRAAGSNDRAFERIVERFRPDAIVLRTLEVERGLQIHGGPLFRTPDQKERFLARYREAARFTAPHIELWGPFAMISVYRRVGS